MTEADARVLLRDWPGVGGLEAWWPSLLRAVDGICASVVGDCVPVLRVVATL